MKIDFNHPDSPSQIEALQNTLKTKSSNKNIALAIVLALRIFYENRPGKLSGKTDYSIHGTGCHNPTSHRNNKTLWGIWRLELTIEQGDEFQLNILHEYVEGGFLKATFMSGKLKWTVTCDVFLNKEEDYLKTTSISISGIHQEILLKELHNWLKKPLDIVQACSQN